MNIFIKKITKKKNKESKDHVINNFGCRSQRNHIHRMMLWEFKQGSSVMATTKLICSVYDEEIITS